MPVSDTFQANTNKRKYIYDNDDENLSNNGTNAYFMYSSKEKKVKTIENENHWNLQNLFEMNKSCVVQNNMSAQLLLTQPSTLQTNNYQNDIQMDDYDNLTTSSTCTTFKPMQEQKQQAQMPVDHHHHQQEQHQTQQIKPVDLQYTSSFSTQVPCWKTTMHDSIYTHRSHFFCFH